MPTDREIARLVEKNQEEATREIAAISESFADGCAAFEAKGSYMNRACGLGVDGPVEGAELDRMIDFFASHEVEPRIEVSGHAHPSLLRGLGERGFVLDTLSHVFARELAPGDDFTSKLPHGMPEGVTIERVDVGDDAALREFLDLAASGFLPEGAEVTDEYRSAGIKNARLPDVDSLVARCDGRVVGVASAATRNGMLTLFGATVAKPFRRRGIQQALIAARLDARVRDASLATIRTLPGVDTEQNALRLGFRLVYARAILVRPAR